MDRSVARKGLVLETEKLRLRDLTESDFESRYELFSDSEVTRFLPEGPKDEKEARECFQKMLASQQSEPRRYFRLAIILKENERFVGDCVCRLCNPTNPEDLSRLMGEAYIGFFLKREFWRHGFGTEVAKTLLGFGFNQLDLRRIWAWCDSENKASARILEGIGMKREGSSGRM